MDSDQSIWLFALAVSGHMLEEVIWLPAWSQDAGRWHVPVKRGEFLLATIIFLAVFYLGVIGAMRGGAESPGMALTAGFAVVFLFNVIVPHLGAALEQRRYAPGLATALLFNLPAASYLLVTLFKQEEFAAGSFIVGTGAALFSALVLWPRLFPAGRWILRLLS